MIKVTKRHHDAALKFVNECRALMGKRPVKRLRKGHRSKASSCVIARTIEQGKNGLAIVGPTSDGFGVEGSFGKKGRDRIRHTKQSKLAHDFIIAFDEGLIPELELR